MIISLLQFLWFVSTRFISENAMFYNGLVFWKLGALAVDGWAVSIYSRCLDHAHVMMSRSSSLVDWDRVNHAQCRRHDGPDVCVALASRPYPVTGSARVMTSWWFHARRFQSCRLASRLEENVKLHLQFLISKATRSDGPVSLRSLHPVCLQHKITVI